MQEMTRNFTIELRRLHHEHHDNCTNCGHSFTKGDTAHLGYDKDDSEIYVCDDCSNLLKETVVRYYFSPRQYQIPDDESKLWRYMDFAKYVSLLNSKKLYFSRADQFDDDFEGAKGVIENKDAWDQFYLSHFKKVIQNPPEGYEVNKTKEEIEKEAQRLLKEQESLGKNSLKNTYLSCWHENQIESEAMWKLYSSYLDNAVAIQTTFKKLYYSLGRDPFIKIGRVQYINFSNSYAGINSAFWRKRKSFEHENEVRAIISDHEKQAPGIKKSCDLEELIEAVHVSPNAPNWFQELVSDITKKFGLNINAQKSNLAADPFH